MSESPINLHKIESEGSAFFKDVRLWRKKLAQNDGYGFVPAVSTGCAMGHLASGRTLSAGLSAVESRQLLNRLLV